MAGFLAASKSVFSWPIFLLCIVTTIFLQILSNLANDYGDSIHGADHAQRKGPSRTVQSGLISLQQMKLAVILFSMLSFVSGISLLFVAFGWNWNAILFFLGLGVLCILAAIGYTVGKRPYGYIGLGDFSVLLFFGGVGVVGSLYLFTNEVDPYTYLPALSCGLFSVGVLNVNNIRDIESDKQAGKFSIPVRIGREKAVVYHGILIISGLVTASVYALINFQSPWQLLFILTAPLFIRNIIAVQQKSSHELDPYLKQLAISTLLFVLLFGIGQML